MTNVPVWIDSAPVWKFPKLERNINVDVLIVGAGITGVTAAYLLKKAGSTVALIEREYVASIDPWTELFVGGSKENQRRNELGREKIECVSDWPCRGPSRSGGTNRTSRSRTDWRARRAVDGG